jgi:hypothetical protein
MQWGDRVTIYQALNGFVVEEEEETVEPGVTSSYVYEEEDGDEHIVSMLYAIVQHFGVYNSKHRKRNLVIEWREEEDEHE